MPDSLQCTRRSDRRHNHKLPAAGISMGELVQKGVPGTLRSEGVGPEGIDQEFEAVAELDGASAKAKARTKRGAEQKAARCVFHALLQGNGRAHGGVWTGTPDAPVAPQQAYE